jgi:hypothetical protein
VFRCVPLSGIEQEVLQRNFLAVLFKWKSMHTQKHMYATSFCSCWRLDTPHEFTLNLSHEQFSWNWHRRRNWQLEKNWQDVPEVRAALIAEAVQVCVCVLVCLHGHHKCYTFDMCDHPATTIHTVSLNSFCNCFFLLIGRKLASMFHLATVYPLMCMCLWTKQVVRKMAYTWEAKFLYWQSRLNFGPLAQNDPTQPLLSPYFYKWCQLAQY